MNVVPAAQARHEEQMLALAQACNALWAATLSLMVAFMHTQAPAHRYLLARRIARNFETLRVEECFPPQTRASFAQLAKRWAGKAECLSPHNEGRPSGGAGLIPSLMRWIGARG
jgi:hypothetical protein